jgi:ribonuclease III
LTTSRYADLETRLGHRFSATALLEQALTHRSHGPHNNERLEFLGDGVLGCAVADLLHADRAALAEGELTRRRAALVRKEALAEVGEHLGLRGLLRTNPGTPVTPSILADAVEAVLGAVFLDAGYEATRAAVLAAFRPLLQRLDADNTAKDPKTRLQEILQAKGPMLPAYSVREEGPAHQRSFEAECVLADRGLRTTGRGASRKSAEQQAAQAMLAIIEK